MSTPGDDIVRVATAANPVEAHIWEEALEGEGIRAKVVGDFLDAGIGDIPGFKAEVWVRRQDLARAEEILESAKRLPPDEASDEEAQS